MKATPAILAFLLMLPSAAWADDATSLFNQSNDAYRHNDFKNAIALSNQALALLTAPHPLRVGIIHLRAAAEARLEDFQAAIDDYDRELAEFNQLPDDMKTKFAVLTDGLLWERGLSKFYAGRYADALVDYDAALAANPHSTITLFDRAKCYVQLGRNDDAIKDLDAALALDPTDKDASDLRAVLK